MTDDMVTSQSFLGGNSVDIKDSGNVVIGHMADGQSVNSHTEYGDIHPGLVGYRFFGA